MIYAASFAVSLVICFLKGLQIKSVAADRLMLAFFSTWCLDAAFVFSIYIVTQGGLATAITSGLGAAIGMIASIKFYNRQEKSDDI